MDRIESARHSNCPLHVLSIYRPTSYATLERMNTCRGFALIPILLIIFGLAVVGGGGSYIATRMGKPALAELPTAPVTNNAGTSTVSAKAILPTEKAPEGNRLHPSVTSGQAPLTVTFTPEISAGSQSINFGDGSSSNDPCVLNSYGEGDCDIGGKTVTHMYTKAGVYEVILARLMPSSIVATTSIRVTEATWPTIQSFTGPTTLAVGQSGTWSVRSSENAVGPITFVVTWGDEIVLAPEYRDVTHPLNRAALGYGQTFSTATVTHSYKQPGTYTIHLLVFGPDAGRSDAPKLMTVTVK